VKLSELIELLQEELEERDIITADKEVVIETDSKQLYPNATYSFEIDADAHRVVLRPTVRR
jgi:hypothetical protein